MTHGLLKPECLQLESSQLSSELLLCIVASSCLLVFHSHSQSLSFLAAEWLQERTGDKKNVFLAPMIILKIV